MKPRSFNLQSCFLLVGMLLAMVSAQAGTLVQFRTTFGDIEVELYNKDKPVTVQNFIRYIQSGRYANEFCHRLEPGFVLQGGGFTLSSNTISYIPTYPPITNEFHVGKFYSNTFGTIAMAKTSNPNSATSQFFFNLADNSASLDNTNNSGGFTVFGHVIKGTNVLNIFNHFQYWTNSSPNPAPASTNLVRLNYYPAPLNELPVLSSNSPVTVSDFVFMDITLLQVAINKVASGREISWNSTAGMTNIVEYTTNMPPVWNTLISTNGDGARMSVIDNSADPKRFYRVRVVN